GGERLAVVEDGVVDELEEPRLVVLLLPRLREPRDELAGLVDVGQLVVDVLVDLQRRVELRVARVHVHGLVDGGDTQGAAALGRALREDGAWSEQAGGGADARRAREPGAAGENEAGDRVAGGWVVRFGIAHD